MPADSCGDLDIGQIALALAALGIVLTGVIFTLLLTIKVYDIAVGIVLSVLALIPCVRFFVLLAVNSRATATLRRNGIPVGLLGAELSRIDVS